MTWPVLLIVYALQAGLLLAVGLLLPRVGLRAPHLRLRYWYALLFLLLLLPLGMTWSSTPEPGAGAEVQWSSAGPWLVASVAQSPQLDRPALWQILLTVLVAGAAWRCFQLLVGWLALRRLRSGSEPLPAVDDELTALHRRLAPDADLRTSDEILGPVTFGWLRPTVLVPRSFLCLPFASRQTVLCHELLHVRRRDWPTVIGEQILSALLWFHPGVSLLLAKISLCREQVIDRDVIRATGARRAYLDALQRFAEIGAGLGQSANGRRALPFFVSLTHRGHLLQRVTHITQEVPMSRKERRLTFPTLLCALLLTAAAAAVLFPWAAAEAETVYRVGGDVTAPVRWQSPMAEYPEAERKSGIEGTVVAMVVIDNEGAVSDIEIQETPGEAFSDATREALSRWVFRPATRNGEPVAVYYTLTINYRLGD